MDTLFPYTTLVRSCRTPRVQGPLSARPLNVTPARLARERIEQVHPGSVDGNARPASRDGPTGPGGPRRGGSVVLGGVLDVGPRPRRPRLLLGGAYDDQPRSEERRVGNACVSTCRSRGSPAQ